MATFHTFVSSSNFPPPAMDLEDSESNDDDFYVIVVNNEQEEDENKSVEGSELKVITELNTSDSEVEFQHSDSEKEFQLLDAEEDSETKVKDIKKSKFRILNSYVEKLRETHPELINDENKLIGKLFEAMKNTRPEKPPENFVKDLESLECSICGSISKTFNQAKRHYQEKHGPRYLLCYACGADFRSSTNLAKHEKKCTAKDAPIVLKARAIIVGSKGRNRPYLNLQPTKKLTNNNRFECSECPATFKSKTSFIGHVNFHKGIKPFTCDTCGVSYTTKVVLLHHIARVHSKKIYICDVCGLTVHLRDILIAHLKTHLPEKSFVCSYPGCDRQYVQKRTLQVHMDVDHNNEPLPHPCQMCHKRFRRTYRLQIHMKNHHGMQLMTRNMFRRILPKMLDTDAIKPNTALFNDSQGLVLNSEVVSRCDAKDVVTQKGLNPQWAKNIIFELGLLSNF